MPSDVLSALRRADPSAPPEIEVFDALFAADDVRPDLFEHSVRIEDGRGPYRLTYYFDAWRRGADTVREVGARYERLALALGMEVPPALRHLVAGASAGDDVLQVVTGLDVARSSEARAKYYLVFRSSPEARMRRLLAAFEHAPLPGADPAKVYIVGCDLTRGGLDDVKLYFRLDRRGLAPLLADPTEVLPLLEASRDLVYQQCLRRPARRQVYFHARSPSWLATWLDGRGLGDALVRSRDATGHLVGRRLEPWIVSFPYDRRTLDLRRGNVYFHLTGDAAA